MALMRVASLTNSLPPGHSREQLAVPISLGLVSPFVATLDLGWIVLLAIVTGLLYDAAAFGTYGELRSYLGSGMAVAIFYSALAHAIKLYSPPNLLHLKWQVGRSILIWITVFALLASIVFLLKIGAMFSRGKMLLFFSCGLMAIVAVRLVVAKACAYIIQSRALAPNQVIVVGSADQLAGNQALLALEQYGYAVARVFELPTTDKEDPQVLKQCMREVVRLVRETQVDEILLALPWSKQELITSVEAELRILPVPVKLVPDRLTSRVLTRPLFDLGPVKAVELQRAPLSAAQRNLKRCMDQAGALIGLFVLMPFMGVIALAIRLESPGPAMFLQTRVGFNGRPFRIYKFRTMTTCDDGPRIVQATRNDKRITHLGGLLRKLSIDEIPQLLNVLRGEMSLVGPRPHALAHDNEYDRLIATYAIRHKMKPGITGWAQINGFRGETPEIRMMKQRVESDILYIECWSLWLDIRILFLTVTRVLRSDEAY
jgi:Undecaprenyl-phosphate glucose phosphotransferase